MPIGTNAIRLADDVRAPDLIENFPFKIQHMDVWPLMEVPGGRLQYTRTNEFPTFGQNITDCADIPEETPLPDEEEAFEFVELATMFRVCYTAQDRFRVPNNIEQRVKRLASRRLSYLFSRVLDTGLGAFPSLESLAGLVIPGSGSALTLGELDSALMGVRENNGYANAIMCNSDGLRAIWQAHYDRGIDPKYMPENFPDPVQGMLEGLRPCLHGVRIYINDMIETRTVEPADLVTNIYFMVLGDSGRNEGRGLTGIIPPKQGGSMFTVRSTPVILPDTSSSTINVDVTWPVGIAIGANSALSMLKDVLITPTT